MTIEHAEKLAKKGARIKILFMDSMYYTHEYYYDKEKFPDKTLRQLVSFLKSFNNDPRGCLRLYCG